MVEQEKDENQERLNGGTAGAVLFCVWGLVICLIRQDNHMKNRSQNVTGFFLVFNFFEEEFFSFF